MLNLELIWPHGMLVKCCRGAANIYRSHAERENEEKRALSEGEITFSGRLNSYFDGVCKQSNVKGRIDIHL